MNKVYQELAERIRGEVPDLERVVQRVLQAWSRGQRSLGEQDVYLESVALNLHGFYSVLERLFELTARHVERNLPAGETWHHDLLQQMTKDMAETRPAVISRESASTLAELRRFRHLVRNVYTFNLVPEKMEPLLSALPSNLSTFQPSNHEWHCHPRGKPGQILSHRPARVLQYPDRWLPGNCKLTGLQRRSAVSGPLLRLRVRSSRFEVRV